MVVSRSGVVLTTEAVSSPARRESFWASYGLATLVYVAGSVLTRPIFISDTLRYLRTATPDNPLFWDFGHLLWRPILWVLLSHLQSADPPDRFLQAFHVVDSLSTAAGLVAVWLAVATLRIFTRRIPVVVVSATILSFTQAVLTHSKGGCAYIFGFTALSAAFYILLAAAKTERLGWPLVVVSGAFLSLAVCLWFPYIFAVPGTLLAPVVFFGNTRKHWRLVQKTVGVCALLGIAAYGAVAIHLGILNFAGFIAWAEASSHGVSTSGTARTFFGLARSFLALGENGPHGVAFKRFLLHDPYNPVHTWQVFASPFWEILVFYAFLISILATLAGSLGGRRGLLQLALTSLPVLGFAVFWAGTDLERYLPLFPALMLAIGLGLNRLRWPSATSVVAGVFVATLVVVNVSTLSRSVRERQLRELTGTVRTLNEFLPPDSLVLLPPIHPLQRIYWDFPEALPLAQHDLKLQRLLDLDTSDTPQWRVRLCSQMSQRWKKKIPVVIESSLLQKTPAADSSWAEGDDPRVGWRDINNFTSQLDLGARIGTTDFFDIPATARNIMTIDGCLAH